MKKLLITAAFLLFITGTALAANKVQDLRSGPDSREPQTVEAQTIGARNTGAQTIYPGQNSAAETSETGGWESMTVRDKLQGTLRIQSTLGRGTASSFDVRLTDNEI